jgi:hypothetical protein
MSKYEEKPRQVQRNPQKTEKRAAMNPVIQPALGDGIKMSAQAHSEAFYDGTTSPHRDALSFDPVTVAEMGNLNDNL